MKNSIDSHTVKSYDKDIGSITNTLDDILLLVIESLAIAEEAINNPKKVSLTNEINVHDYKINNLDNLIERKVVSILALRQPMASDLRYITSSLKVSSNLERMGDKTKNIITKLHYIDQDIDEKINKLLLDMLCISKNMAIDAVDAFNKSDEKKALKVLQDDQTIDKIYSNLFNIEEKDQYNQNEVRTVVNIFFIAKSLERLADYAVNIAEITKYVISGEI